LIFIPHITHPRIENPKTMGKVRIRRFSNQDQRRKMFHRLEERTKDKTIRAKIGLLFIFGQKQRARAPFPTPKKRIRASTNLVHSIKLTSSNIYFG
jgi:hypothetical protein